MSKQAYCRQMSKKVLAIAFKWGKLHLKALSYTVVLRWSWKRDNHGTEEHSKHHLLAHRLLNHSFKATQLKSGSFRVTVDGVPKALDILHKEKITCQLVKAVMKKDVCQVMRTSQKFQLAKLKTKPKASGSTRWSSTVQTFREVNPTSLVCVDVTHNI